MQKPTSICALVLTLCTANAIAATRPAPPAADELAKLRQDIQHQYAELYSSPDRVDQLSLCSTLWKSQVKASTPNEQFAMLCEARDAAARAGDLTLAYRACESMTGKFAVTPASVRADVFTSAANGVGSLVDPDVYFTKLTAAIDEAMSIEDFEPARKMVQTGVSTAGNLQSKRWELAMSNRQADLAAQQKAFIALAPSVERLRQDNSDQPATLALGEYQSFIKGDWKSGLPLMDEGDTEYLHKYSRIERYEPMNESDQIRDGKMDGKLQMSIADNWDSLDGTLPPEYALQLHLHAFDWYMRSLSKLPDIADDDREHVVAQLRKLLPAVESRRPNAGILITICESLSRKLPKPTAIVGGPAAGEPFSNIPENGALLIGFHYSLAMLDGQKVITYLQPIYSTPAGEIAGPSIGRQFSKGQTVRAPYGYAIGAMKIYAEDYLQAITPAFMRIEKDRLNPNDVLLPTRIGGDGGSPVVYDGNGVPITGIVGRQRDGYIGLGLVFAKPVK